MTLLKKNNGILYGPFGAIDRLAVRIQSPGLSKVSDPGNYYCRKGFYALNVQAIVDKRKRFLWTYPSNKGSTHDSAAFQGSRLFQLLCEMGNDFSNHGLFPVGDSAYGLAPFLLVPYDGKELEEDLDHSLDSFNFHLSSCRIYVECAFGELVMRWGIFWRTLLFDLKKCTKIIQVGILLHNFIIDEREGFNKDASYFQNFSISMDPIQQQITDQTNEIPRALVTDNNEPGQAGRHSIEEDALRLKGIEIRNRLTVKLAANGRRRPILHDMQYNAYGHVYFT